MKKLLLVLACVSCAMSASAQRFFSAEPANQPITFGVRAGLNISDFTQNPTISGELLKAKAGFNVGVNVDFPLLESLYLQSGLYFSLQGAKYKYTETDVDYYEKYVVNYNPCYLQLPILASYRYNFKDNLQLQVNLGPYFAVALGGKANYKYEVNDDGEAESYKEKNKMFGKTNGYPNGYKRGDIGWIVGAGVTWQKLYFGFNYGFGFMNILKNSPNYSEKNSTFSINVGYNF